MILTGSLIGSSPTELSAPSGELTQAGHYQLVGTHPQASQQPTATGKTLHFLRHWEGAIYAGYGDYGANTGPIAITPFALSTNQFTADPALWADTEELQIFRVLNGSLYAPYIDPHLVDDYSVTSPTGPWMGRDVVQSTHVYDMVARTGSELWMVGSADADAVAWRSLDQGATWTTALTVPPTDSRDYARFYFAAVYENRLYLQSVDSFGYTDPGSRVFDGSTWSAGPDLLPDSAFPLVRDPEIFDGQLVYLAYQGSTWAGFSLLAFDGAEVRNTGQTFASYSIDGDTLYGLAESGRIRKTTDLESWTELETHAPETARSIVVIDGMIYIGTTDSRIYRSPPVAPTITGTDPASPANDDNPEVRGTVGAGSPIRVKIYENASCSGVPDAIGTIADFTGAGITVDVTGDATTALSARASDATDNNSECSDPIDYTEDSTAPAAPLISATDPATPSNLNDLKVKGSAEADATVKLYESSACSGPVEAQGSSSQFASPGLSASVAVNATTDFTATATDQAGNTSKCSRPFAYHSRTCRGIRATIVGTTGDDLRSGTPGADVMVGLAGNDKLSGLAGNDLICGGAGKDTLNGGNGSDRLYGQRGKDTLTGGPGKDELKGGTGKDKQVQ